MISSTITLSRVKKKEKKCDVYENRGENVAQRELRCSFIATEISAAFFNH
jgi:hypothetical protein